MAGFMWVCSVAMLLSAGVLNAQQYKTVKNEKGIQVLERWIQHAQYGEIRELKAVFTVNGSFDDVVSLLKNELEGTKWNTNCSRYKIVKAEGEQWYNYIRYDLPWPVDDQDCVLKFSVTNKDTRSNSYTISFKNTTHSKYPSYKGVKRLPYVNGQWVITEQGNGTSSVQYIISTSKSKTLPSRVTDPIIRNQVVETFSNFRKLF